ncbi:MAG: DUF4349 domain-containing protein [Gemmataceae bacterium]
MPSKDGRYETAARAPQPKEAGGGARKEEPAAKEEIQQKLIYNGTVRLVTAEFDKSKALLTDLIKDYKGYTLKAEEQSTPGVPRRLTVTARVPAGRSEEFRKDAARAGEVVSSGLDATDVTDQYYDTKAELVNREAREAALRELYKTKQAGSKLSELLEIDREIERVRSDINVRVGRIKRWDKLTEYATFTVTLEERTGYAPQESPYLSTRLVRTFTDSLTVMVRFAEGVALFLAGAVPWLALAAVVIGPIYLLTRTKPEKVVPPAPPPRRPPTEFDSPETIAPQ